MGEEITYLVLAYEDHCGLWLKVEALDLQCCGSDLDFGLESLDEALQMRRWSARKEGRELLERLDRDVKWVSKEEFGPTQQEIDGRRYLEELAEDYADDEEQPSPPVVVVNVCCELQTSIWTAEIPGMIRGTLREKTAGKLMHRVKATVDGRLGYSKRDERRGRKRPG